MKSITRLATTSALAVALALPAAAQDENQKANDQNSANEQATTQEAANQESASDKSNEDKADKEDKDKSEQQTRQLQIFELKHTEPEHVQQILALNEGITQPTLNRGALGRRSAFRPGARAAAGGETAEDDDKVTIAVASEEKLLFARGPAERLDEIKKLVDAVDVESGNLQPIDYADHRLLPISGDKASRVQQTLAQLNLNCQMLRFGDTTLIALRTDKENSQESEQAEKVVQKLNDQDKEKDKDKEKNRDKAEKQESGSDESEQKQNDSDDKA